MPPPARSRCRAVRAVMLSLCVAFLAACTGSARQDAPAAPVRDPALLYSELQYWPANEPGDDNGQSCVPVSMIGFEDESATDLWERVRSGYGLEGEVDEQRIAGQMRVYARKQRTFDTIDERASWYLYYVVEQLEQRNMPLEIALLPIVESGYDPQAVSPSRAAGVWQIIPGTGTRMGLEQNSLYDGRKDVIASTEAALDYLSELHKRFDGDWYLALAAYNAGEGSVQRAIERNRRLGKPTDYWSLPLSRQACDYVPRLLALSRLLEDPADHGLHIAPIPNEPSVVPVEVDRSVDLAQAAQLAGIDRSEFSSLNAGYKRGYTAPGTPNTLLVPAAQHDEFIAVLQDLPDLPRPSAHPERYRVRPGDTLGGIARLYETTPQALRAINGLAGDAITAGEYLKLPRDAVLPPAAYPTSESVALKNRGIYVVRPGDSLWKIAKRFGTSTAELARLNELGPNARLGIGQTLRVRAAEPRLAISKSSGRRKVDYTVRSGDSLALIAGRFKVALREVMEWNGIDARRPTIHPGQSLVLYVTDSGAAI